MDKKHIPIRMCTICKARAAKHLLTRYILFQKEDVFHTDEKQCMIGRGWYVCSKKNCWEKFRRFRVNSRKRKGD